MGDQVTRMLPAYPQVLNALESVRSGTDLGTLLGGHSARLLESVMPDTGVKLMLVDCPTLYARGGNIYQNFTGEDWPDNHLRFGLLARAAALVAVAGQMAGWRPDVLHANDALDVVIAARLPAPDSIRASMSVVADVRRRFWLTTDLLEQLATSSTRLDSAGVESWTTRIAPSDLVYRVEVFGETASRSGVASGLIPASTSDFPLHGRGISDVLVAERVDGTPSFGARWQDLEVVAAPLKKMNLRCSWDDERFVVEPSSLTAARRITTGLWPGFPSDMVSLVTVLATQAEGETLVHDWMYELRLFALEQLSAMRADLFLCDPHRIIVSGPTKLRGRHLDSRDIRSGMALIAAALAAEGESRVGPLETVERGYAALVERLTALGAQVERLKN